MKVSPVSLMAAALSASFAPPVREEDQATCLARITGQSPDDVRAELTRLGYYNTSRTPDVLPPRKADPVRKKERKAARDARKRNRR